MRHLHNNTAESTRSNALVNTQSHRLDIVHPCAKSGTSPNNMRPEWGMVWVSGKEKGVRVRVVHEGR